MKKTLQDFISGITPVPAEMLAWRLHGAGLDNLGRDHQPVVLPTPHCGPHQLLARVDAVGLCFSDTKIINQAEQHPKMKGMNFAEQVVVPGHEVSLTIVKVGEELRREFVVGKRFTLQADIYINGQSTAYGYRLPGGLAQFNLIGNEILNADAGCHLIPVKEHMGYAEVALVEPWTCVEASYAIEQREAPKEGGTAWIIGARDRSSQLPPLPQDLCRKVFVSNFAPETVVQLHGGEAVHTPELNSPALGAFLADRTQGSGVDDIIMMAPWEPRIVEKAASNLAQGGVLDLVAQDDSQIDPRGCMVRVDVGRIHYHNIRIVGCADGNWREAYSANLRKDLRGGGICWLLGAGGPMGQMHLQRAIQLRAHPQAILVTDIDDRRLDSLQEKFSLRAEKRRVQLEFANPLKMTPEAFRDLLEEQTARAGFDDIVVLAPVPAVIEEAARCLAVGGVVNIFAGVALGTFATLDLNSVVTKRVRFVGRSGSSIEDMQRTLQKAEAGEIAPNNSVAAIGGMNAPWEGMKAVKEGSFSGKIVIFPHIRDLPLMPLADLKEKLPAVHKRLRDETSWTREAELQLLSDMMQ